jgi:hypothetical protein
MAFDLQTTRFLLFSLSDIDVKLPRLAGVQRVSYFVLDESVLSGSFTLSVGAAMTSGVVGFDVTTEELKSSL